MKFHSRYLRRLAGFSVSQIIRQWMSTLETKAAYYDPSVDPTRHDFYGQFIVVFWHEYIPAAFHLRGRCNIAMLLSRHRDADWLAEAARFAGIHAVRGSSSRGGTSALIELCEAGENRNLAITPDGPRGPRRRMSQGPIYLASRLGIPLVPMGIGYDRPRRMNTWDKFAVPRPFSRCRVVVAPRMYIPKQLQRTGVEHYRDSVERMLNRLTCEAEAWAASGTHKQNELPMSSQPSLRRRFPDLSKAEVAIDLSKTADANSHEQLPQAA